MEKDWMMILQQQNQLEQVMKTNQKTERFGLSLTKQDAELILAETFVVEAEKDRVWRRHCGKDHL